MKFKLVCLQIVSSAALVLSGCSGGDPAEESLEIAAELRAATDRGPLRLGASVSGSITGSEPRSAWRFTLTGGATVQLRTEASSAGEIDTVLLLQRENARGVLRTVARSDDEAAGSFLSSLERPLEAGNYRVVVQGKNARVRGEFVLASACNGPGCGLACDPAPDTCLFGSSFYELMHGESAVEIAGEEQIRSVAQLADPVWRQQLVLAVQQSSHTDVTTPEEALLRVDQQTVRRLWLVDHAGSRAFTAYEYGAGDNSYGALFNRGTTEIVASIHDGDFLRCTVRPGRCLLGPSYAELQYDPRLELDSRVLLRAGTLGSLADWERAQLRATLERTYGDASNLEATIALADAGEVTQLTYRHRPTGRALVIYEHRAGDTSVGAVFEGHSAAAAAVISDGAFEDCRLF